MGDVIIMSKKERESLKILEMVKNGGIKKTEASKILGISYRQVIRIVKRYMEEGDKGIIHRSRGKRRITPERKELRERVISIYKERYNSFGPTFTSEKMEEEYGIKINHETLRLWLKEEGLWNRQRKRDKYRSRRDRKKHFGEMVQIDGSHHRWFEDRGDKCCYFNMIDDATNISMGYFGKGETTELALISLKKWIKKYGVPRTIYCDRKEIFIVNPCKNEEYEEERLTVFGEACKKLGIKIIYANSPQAKGRIERRNGIDQDRLIKEMRLRKISNIAEANKFLDEYYLDKMNNKFSIEPMEKDDYHIPKPDDKELEEIMSWNYDRKISKDYVVSFNGEKYQLTKETVIKNNITYRNKIRIQIRLDKSMHMCYKDTEIDYIKLDYKKFKLKEDDVA